MATPLNYDGRLKGNAQRLRRELTRQERHLWYDYLKSCPAQFRRQKQFGGYIVDFYCAACQLVVELDGSRHYEQEEEAKDKARTTYLNSLGLKVVRFSNLDVDTRFTSVYEAIDAQILRATQNKEQVETIFPQKSVP